MALLTLVHLPEPVAIRLLEREERDLGRKELLSLLVDGLYHRVNFVTVLSQ
ncbi:hypothetical protein BOO71_0010807 [Deinococcus marmoris]|uniref:Uncharacterized protein n=1 Tax=Deinococcus marmoris TaxID=249408 RepID=A0A1U7NV45_9DEIO|nr:hypothetical protein BOO71_0010807 [Deinococcus marmoris]